MQQLLERSDIEVRARRGHDLFAFPQGVPFGYEESVLDLGGVHQAQRRVGPPATHVQRAVRNAKNGRCFAFPDFWVAQRAFYCSDLWAKVGCMPKTWGDVRRVGPALGPREEAVSTYIVPRMFAAAARGDIDKWRRQGTI